jgi:hypothetical protein
MNGSSENRLKLFKSYNGCFRAGVGIGIDLATLVEGLALSPLVDTDPDSNPETVSSLSRIFILYLCQHCGYGKFQEKPFWVGHSQEKDRGEKYFAPINRAGFLAYQRIPKRWCQPLC